MMPLIFAVKEMCMDLVPEEHRDDFKSWISSMEDHVKGIQREVNVILF